MQQMNVRRYTMVAEQEGRLKHQMDHLHEHVDKTKTVSYHLLRFTSRLYWLWTSRIVICRFVLVNKKTKMLLQRVKRGQSKIKLSIDQRRNRFVFLLGRFKCEYLVLSMLRFRVDLSRVQYGSPVRISVLRLNITRLSPKKDCLILCVNSFTCCSFYSVFPPVNE